MCVVLILFEALSGLKVNFSKSHLVDVNIADSWLSEATFVFRCRVGCLPFVYLGLLIGGDVRRLDFWKLLVLRINSSLLGWKSRHLSFGGHLVLLKYVRSSLPIYALSFFKAPSGIISSIESILNFFFWGEGGREDRMKIYWIDWKSVCLMKEVGGLWVRRIREFNSGLLGKWCWQLLVDLESFWFRVLAARYGVEGGRLKDEGLDRSIWWRDISTLRGGVV